MRSFVQFLQALADETRWRIVEMLLVQPLCIHELVSVLDLPQSTVSSQVQALRRAGVLVGTRAGHEMLHRIAEEHRPFILAAKTLWGVSERIDGALLKDAKRARRLVAARAQRGAARSPS